MPNPCMPLALAIRNCLPTASQENSHRHLINVRPISAYRLPTHLNYSAVTQLASFSWCDGWVRVAPQLALPHCSSAPGQPAHPLPAAQALPGPLPPQDMRHQLEPTNFTTTCISQHPGLLISPPSLPCPHDMPLAMATPATSAPSLHTASTAYPPLHLPSHPASHAGRTTSCQLPAQPAWIAHHQAQQAAGVRAWPPACLHSYT